MVNQVTGKACRVFLTAIAILAPMQALAAPVRLEPPALLKRLQQTRN
jgi:hypothetical protein